MHLGVGESSWAWISLPVVTPQTVVILPRPVYQLPVGPHLVVRRPHELCPIHVRYLVGFIMLRSSGGNHKVLEEEAEKL